MNQTNRCSPSPSRSWRSGCPASSDLHFGRRAEGGMERVSPCSQHHSEIWIWNRSSPAHPRRINPNVMGKSVKAAVQLSAQLCSLCVCLSMFSPGSGCLSGKRPLIPHPGTSVGSIVSCSEPGRIGEPAPPPRPPRPAARTSAGAVRRKKRQTDGWRRLEHLTPHCSRRENGRETHFNEVSGDVGHPLPALAPPLEIEHVVG